MSSSSDRIRRTELSWEAAPTRELVRLSWPIAVSMVSYSLMTLTNTLFVGRLGAAALAGVGIGGMAAFTLMCFSFGLLRGTKTLVSQATGALRHDDVRAHFAAGVLVAAALGVLTLLASLLVAETLPALAGSATSGAYAREYLIVRMLGAPSTLVYVALREARYGMGHSRLPMVTSLIANGINIVLDWVFVLELGWGVPGAAWGSVIADGAGVAMMLLAQRRDGLAIRSVTIAHLRALWRIGVPTGAQFLLEVGSFSLVTAMLAGMGDMQIAAHQIAIQVIHFTFLPTMAVSEAASVLSGQAVGADRDSLVRDIGRRAMWVAGGYAVLCTIVLATSSRALAEAFTSDVALHGTTASLLVVAGVFQVFDAANIVARGVLRGTGDVRYPAVIGIATAWASTPPLTWLLGYVLSLGALGAWLGLCAEIIVGAGLLWWRLRSDAWVGWAERSRRELGESAQPAVVAAAA